MRTCKQLLIALALAWGHTVWAADMPSFPFLVATGTAKGEMKPDSASVALHIQAWDKSAATAVDIVTRRSSEVVELAEKLGIQSGDLKSQPIDKEETRKYDEDHNMQEILGYDVSRKVSIDLHDLSRYGELTDALERMDNVTSVYASFDSSTREQTTADLMRQAGTKAQTQARQLAAAAGVTLGNVEAVSTGDMSELPARFGISGEPARSRFNEIVVTSARAPHRSTNFVPESIPVEVTLNLLYRIIPTH